MYGQGGQIYTAVSQAIATLQTAQAQAHERMSALQTLDQVKQGEIHASTEVCVALLNTPALEVQLSGFELLTYLATHRWEAFSDVEHRQLLEIALSQLQRVAASGDARPLRSRSAMLLAALLKRQGAEALQGVMTQLLTFGKAGPIHTEMACFVLTSVAEEVTQFYDDLNQDVKRSLLSALTSSLSMVLPFLVSSLETHFQSVQQHKGVAGQEAAVQQHQQAVKAALATASVYVEWCPLKRILDASLLQAAAFLMNTTDFKEDALEVFRQVSERKQQGEEMVVYQNVMQVTGEALMSASAALLSASPSDLDYEGQYDEYGRRLCDTMACYGQTHFGNGIKTTDKRITFLQQMLSLAQHSYLLLSDAALPFWVELFKSLSEKMAKQNSAPSPEYVPPDCVAALLDLAGQQLLRGVHLVEDDLKEGDIPPYFDNFMEYKDVCVGYRQKLSQIVRYTAQLLPGQALQGASRRLAVVLPMCSQGSGVDYMQQKAQLEAAVVYLDSVVNAVSESHLNARQPTDAEAAISGLESLLQQVLGAVIVDPYLLYFHARALEPWGRLVALRPVYAEKLIDKVFQMLDLSPLGNECIPPARTTLTWKDAFHARQRTAVVVQTNAKVAPAAFLPHMESLASRVQQELAAGKLRLGERNAFAEALLAAALGADDAKAGQVLEWVLSMVRTDWTSAAFLASLSNPQAFLATYLQLQRGVTNEVGGREARWTLYHEVHLFLRVFKALTLTEGSPSPPSGPGTPTKVVGPSTPISTLLATKGLFGPHAAWALPPLLQLTACVHAIPTPALRVHLHGHEAALFAMPPAERAVYLKQSGQAARVQEEESGDTLATVTLASARQWLRTLRETLYQVLGSVAAVTPGFWDNEALRSAWPVALLGDVQSMEHQHLRILLRHVLLPFLKLMRPEHRTGWALPLLHALLPHMYTRLTEAWQQRMDAVGTGGHKQQGALAPSGLALQGSGGDDRADTDDIIAHRLLVELTREFSNLAVLLMERPPDGTDTLQLCLLKQDQEIGFAAIALATAALAWQDAATHPCAAFCRYIISLASKDATLANYVGTEMLAAAIRALSRCNFVPFSGELLQLIRDILVQQLGKSPGPTQVLSSLPGVTESSLTHLAASLQHNGSEKEQRGAIKKFLMQSGGPMFQQLSEWRSGATVPSIRIAEPQAKGIGARSTGKADGPDFGVAHMFNQLMENNLVH